MCKTVHFIEEGKKNNFFASYTGSDRKLFSCSNFLVKLAKIRIFLILRERTRNPPVQHLVTLPAARLGNWYKLLLVHFISSYPGPLSTPRTANSKKGQNNTRHPVPFFLVSCSNRQICETRSRPFAENLRKTLNIALKHVKVVQKQ